MTQTKQQCSTTDQLLNFLRGQLSAREEADLQHHLDDCVSCRERLESTAADVSVWNEAREFFASGALHGSSKDSSEDHEEAGQGSPRIRQVLDSLGPTDDPESLGRIGGYEVTGVVGAGGMGVVLKAHDRSLDRIVAVKVMSPHLASIGSARKRFAREAKAAAAVLHPNVIAIHSVASEEASPFLVMPFVRGASLQKRIDSQGPLPLKDTLRIGAQIAAGLAAAHEQGLVHRDIKPANILLEEGVERVTITDFGLARAVDDASMTCSGVIAGTPQYMSPEQARGEPIDARSDLFSLGGVLYAMCTGRSPFRAETTYGVLHRIANDKPTPVCEVNADVPVWLGQVIERLMAKRPEDRFESAAQVAALLEGCLAHVQQPAAMPLPEAVTALSPRKTRRPPIGKFIAAAAFVFAFIFAGVFVVLELNKGTLTIQSDVDDIQVRITRGKDVVNELKVSKSGQSVRLTAGQYEVELIGQADGLTVQNGQVTLQRADTEVVRITHKTHDTHDTILPPSFMDSSSFNDSNAAIQTKRSNSSDSLDETIDKFNEYLNRNPQNDQPILTRDELIACAAWNLEPNHELTETQYVALSKIAKQHQFPEGWRIDGSYLMLPPYTTPVKAYRISLVHSTTGEVITIRERFIEPPAAYAKPILNASPEGTQLRAAIKRFNARYNQADGYKQPPLTEDEVVAAIVHHQTKRDEADVSDTLFEKFQQIARQRYLPKETSLDVIPTFGVVGGSTYTIWSIRIKMLQDEPGKEGWTYAFQIREQFVSVKHGDAGEIHWGQPAENGLQAGVRLSPALLSYELGQKIDVQILYRNILSKPIAAGVPNFCGYELAVHDANGTTVEIFDLHEPMVVGGARSEQIGDEPVSSRGRSLAFAPKSMTKDELTDYRSKTGASILILVDPGKSYRLQFEVSNVADATDGTLKTGGVEIAVEKAQKHSTTHESVRKNGKGKIIVGEEAGPNVAQPAPVKIVVHDEEGKPLEGVKVSLYQLASTQAGQVLEINETSNTSGVAVDRKLPYGHYKLSAKTAYGWVLAGYDSRLNVEFEKGLDAVLVVPTPSKTSKLVFSSDIKALPEKISRLRFGQLREGNFTAYVPEPEGSDSNREREFESFPTIMNGIETIGAEIRLEISRTISQPAPSLQHVNTRWNWTPAPNSQVNSRYLIAHGQARRFEQGLSEDNTLARVPVDGSEFFKLPSSKHCVGASMLKLGEPTELPFELDIPAGNVKVKIGSFLGKPNAKVMDALSMQSQAQQPELWLEAMIAADSAWVERLINMEWLNSPIRGSGGATFPLLWREQTLRPGERLEIPLAVKQATAAESQAPAIDHRNARSVVEAYVTSALAGDVAKVASLAKNSPADPKQIQELPEFLNVQRLKIATVYVNDPAKPAQALATSVAVKLDEEHKNPDGRRDGFLVFRLEFADDKWFVIDIDFEAESGAEKELSKFLKANPNSISIPPQSQSLSR